MRRRARSRGAVDVRAALAEHLRGELDGRPWMRGAHGPLLARLEAGEEVVVRGWRVRRWVPALSRAPHVRLGADGTVEPVEPVRDGMQIIEWVP